MEAIIMLLTLFVWPVYGQFVQFTHEPSVIKPPFTKSLEIGCSLTVQEGHNVGMVTGIIIKRGQDDLATVTSFLQPTALIQSEKFAVIGNLNQSSGFLNLTWTNPSRKQSGDFLCEVNALSKIGHSLLIQTKIQVNMTKPDINDLVDAMIADKEEILDLVNTQRKNKDQMRNMQALIKSQRKNFNLNFTRLSNQFNNQLNNLRQDVGHIEQGEIYCGDGGSAGTNTDLGDKYVTFAKPYKKPPTVIITLRDVKETSDRYGLYIYAVDISTTGFKARCFLSEGSVAYLRYHWFSFPKV